VGHTGVGDHALDALDGAAQELGQVLTVVEPVVVAAEKLEGVGAAAVAGFDQAVGQPGAGVGAALGVEDGVLRIGHDVAVALAARGDAVDDLIEALAQLGVRGPAQGVAGAHEEAAGIGTGEIGLPELVGLAKAGRVGPAGAVVKLF
jgi:hypothetical protein